MNKAEQYKYKWDIGHYSDKEYFKNSFKTRPLYYINQFRKENKVRELKFISKTEIKIKEQS